MPLPVITSRYFCNYLTGEMPFFYKIRDIFIEQTLVKIESIRDGI